MPSYIIATPFGLGLPYPALFVVPDKHATKRRPSRYFWEKVVAPPQPAPPAPLEGENNTSASPNQWLEDDSPGLSESEDEESRLPPPRVLPSKKKSFARIREIAFRAFIPKAGSKKSSTVIATEVVSHHQTNDHHSADEKGSSIFTSWRIKSRGANTRIKKLTAKVKRRINSRSPPDQIPKTWEEYHKLYAKEQIDINDPPPPPTEPNKDAPTPWEIKCYAPPLADDEPIRQLVLNRLGMFGKGFDSSDEAAARSHQRDMAAEALEASGQVPETLSEAWERSSTTSSDMSQEATRAMMNTLRASKIPPETLEHHPVFRKIVRQCRETFGASISLLSVMTEHSQIFLAESGLPSMREAPREATICVPLLAPNLDGSPESDEAACPIGTLCIVDDKPREEFGIEERKKLVYMAEYARREIEKWFQSKLAVKVEGLEETHKTFVEDIQKVEALEEDSEALPWENDSEVINHPYPQPNQGQGNLSIRRSPSQANSLSKSLTKSKSSLISKRPSLFDDPTSMIRPRMQKVFDLATKLIGDSINFSLVYLLAVSPHGDSKDMGRTMVISGYNLPARSPDYDAGLHLRVLRTPEGGLLYQNPSAQEGQEAGLTAGHGSNPYASAILVRVGPETNAGGFVIGGFTIDPKRVFGGEDVAYMKRFAGELTRYTSKLRL
ncbi:uncharacterized protein MELLADRAFT_79817 [Melampsora larici-populina 98AG31]|uniref:GAF domain-containing protein n=1 Tax=Melampsora larici-populina (strain 98AG31 / pathotype 3-4-7) TaxID=747676 RepID=F4SCJ3_MELLP|nr:uncharacterized protein MELLADRAFT_79817 [Melampsora larici-populina 98AG31]EGF97636.1 hypothetical protein MELLADRAFT_79817 [Melampsora larici-populina 98AG31]